MWRGDHRARTLFRGGTDSDTPVPQPILNTKQAGRLAIGRHPVWKLVREREDALAAWAGDFLARSRLRFELNRETSSGAG